VIVQSFYPTFLYILPLSLLFIFSKHFKLFGVANGSDSISGKLNKKFSGKITFVGNISPQMLSTGTIAEIKNYSKRLIKELAPGGGYIFSSGHSINPAVTLDRFQTALKIREKYGKYPINIH